MNQVLITYIEFVYELISPTFQGFVFEYIKKKANQFVFSIDLFGLNKILVQTFISISEEKCIHLCYRYIISWGLNITASFHQHMKKNGINM